ncbi:MAG: hypothetical protein K2G50_01885, partial [Anaeroplasmataceae bacterium]|nr:hypothetical protein [Anaeroplasmataceae bacterium]
MKKYRQGLLFFTSILMIFFLISCSSVKLPSDVEPSDNPTLDNEDSNEIPLLLMDEGLSQEMKMSQIRADLIKKNNGYT